MRNPARRRVGIFIEYDSCSRSSSYSNLDHSNSRYEKNDYDDEQEHEHASIYTKTVSEPYADVLTTSATICGTARGLYTALNTNSALQI